MNSFDDYSWGFVDIRGHSCFLSDSGHAKARPYFSLFAVSVNQKKYYLCHLETNYIT